MRQQWSESKFQSELLTHFQAHGWLTYHTYDSRKSAAGFPDIVAVHPGRRLALFVELKRQHRSPVRPEQQVWLDALDQVAIVRVDLWRPSDWDRAMELIEGRASVA